MNLATDRPFWISRYQFEKYFDQSDFACRKCIDVQDVYLSEWFHSSDHGERMFILPTVQFVNRKTQFINGRHRTAVLMQHLGLLPIALVHPLRIEQELLIELTQQTIKIEDFIELPDLPTIDGFSSRRS